MSNSRNGSAAGVARDVRREIDRFNARMRHVHGVAASVLDEAEKVFAEIWQACQDPRTPEEIIDGVELQEDALPSCGWPEFLDKVHLLGHYLDYARRLMEGAIERPDGQDKGIEE